MITISIINEIGFFTANDFCASGGANGNGVVVWPVGSPAISLGVICKTKKQTVNQSLYTYGLTNVL